MISGGSDVIEIDRRTGRRSGSGAVESLGLSAMALAAYTLTPVREFGFSYAAKALAKVLPSSKSLRLRLSDGTSFDFPYGDPYWSRLLRSGKVYEEDMEVVLEQIAGDEFAFVDCGANFGYWSVRMSGPQLGPRPVVAIEAASDTFEWLERNCVVNGRRFAVLNRAISGRSGDRVSLFGAKHEARSIVSAQGTSVGQVETIALDSLLERDELKAAKRVVLKLDVEGAELVALSGGSQMLDRDALVIYEEHGNDNTHSVTRHMLNVMNFRIFGVTGHRVWELRDLDQLKGVKVSRRWGYNFFATRSPFWISRMEGLVGPSQRRRS